MCDGWMLSPLFSAFPMVLAVVSRVQENLKEKKKEITYNSFFCSFPLFNVKKKKNIHTFHVGTFLGTDLHFSLFVWKNEESVWRVLCSRCMNDALNWTLYRKGEEKYRRTSIYHMHVESKESYTKELCIFEVGIGEGETWDNDNCTAQRSLEFFLEYGIIRHYAVRLRKSVYLFRRTNLTSKLSL